MNRFLEIAREQRRAIGFATVALALLGAWAYVRTPAAIFPDMHFSRVDVVADAPNLPPEQTRSSIALPLERSLQGLPGIRRLEAASAQGSVDLAVTFDPSSQDAQNLQRVDAAVAQVRGELPAGTSVQSTLVTPQTEPVVSYALTSPVLSPTLLREYAIHSLVPSFHGIPGLARVLVAGGAQREYAVDLDPAALAAAKLTAQDVSQALADANAVTAAGTVADSNQQRTVLVDAALHGAARLSTVNAVNRDGNTFPVGSLGIVRTGIAPLTQQASFDARHATLVNFYAAAGADNVRMAQAVDARFATLRVRLAPSIDVRSYWNATQLVVESQAGLRNAILIGAVLALGVILLFLRSLRMTVVAASIIPAAMAITVGVIAAFGQTLNIMSVGGLAISVGLIIDDAIVVIEAIAHRMHDDGIGVDLATSRAMRRLAGPMIASTLATVAAFLPLALVGGVAGAFFRTLSITISCALLVSLGLALLVTPTLFRALVAPALQPAAAPNPSEQRWYSKLLFVALRRRGWVFAAAGATLAITIVALATLPTDFLPRLDEGQFEIGYHMPVGTNLAASDAAATRLERAVLADPAVSSEGRLTGIDTNGFSPTPVNAGTIRVRLRPAGGRASFETIAARLRARLGDAVPAADLNVHQILEDTIDDISGAPAPIQVVISGNDQAVLAATATRIAGRMDGVAGVSDVFSGVTREEPVLQVQPQFAGLARTGSSVALLSSAVAAATSGTIATTLTETVAPVPVRVTAGAGYGLPAAVQLGDGTAAFSKVAATRLDRTATDVLDIDGARSLVVTANVSGGSLSDAVAGIREAIATAHVPAGYRSSIEGAYRAQQTSFEQFAAAIGLAGILTFFVMLVLFGSFRQPLAVLSAVLLAPIGVAIALRVTGTSFNVASFMGLLLLVGLVVKNGILLVDSANHYRAGHRGAMQALIFAGRERLRPILMTTLAAIGGLLPLAFGFGAGAGMERPLAIAVVGGLSTATLFTLVLIPAAYAALTPEGVA